LNFVFWVTAGVDWAIWISYCCFKEEEKQKALLQFM
jgi:hypothetical protein